MSKIITELSEDEFDQLFPLVSNHLNPTASWTYDDGRGCLFETFGEELEFVKRQDPLTIWTLVDGDDGDMYVLSGAHFVNRIGYLVSTLPRVDDATVQVRIVMERDDESRPTLQQSDSPTLTSQGDSL